MNEPKTIKAHCNACGRETKQHIRFVHKVSDSEDVDEGRYTIEWGSIYTVLECGGCEDISLKRESWFSEEPGETVVTYYPPRISRRKPNFFNDIPSEYTSLLEEIYSALHADSRRLAVMGVRALFDMFIARKVGDLGNFAKGMDALEDAGFITNRNSLVIKAAIDAGHAAAHRGHLPSVENVSLVMDIIENLFQNDLLSESADSLRDSTPPRPKKNR